MEYVLEMFLNNCIFKMWGVCKSWTSFFDTGVIEEKGVLTLTDCQPVSKAAG